MTAVSCSKTQRIYMWYCRTGMGSFFLDVPTIDCTVYKAVETGKEGQQLNCRKFKAIRSLSLVAGRNIHPDSRIRVYSDSRKQGGKGAINVCYFQWEQQWH